MEYVVAEFECPLGLNQPSRHLYFPQKIPKIRKRSNHKRESTKNQTKKGNQQKSKRNQNGAGRQRHGGTETQRHRHTETDRDRETQRQTETDRDRRRQAETDRDRQRQAIWTASWGLFGTPVAILKPPGASLGPSCGLLAARNAPERGGHVFWTALGAVLASISGSSWAHFLVMFGKCPRYSSELFRLNVYRPQVKKLIRITGRMDLRGQ